MTDMNIQSQSTTHSHQSIFYQLTMSVMVVISAIFITVQFSQQIWTGQVFLSAPVIIIIVTGLGIYLMLTLSHTVYNFNQMFGIVLVLGIIMMRLANVSFSNLMVFNISILIFRNLSHRVLPYFSPLQKASFSQWLHSLKQYRSLIRLWIKYQILSRYSQTLLGILWIIIQPLVTSLILAVAFSQLFNRQMRNDIPFIAFFLSGLTFWNFFNTYILSGSNLLVSSMGLQVRVYFPREILVLVHLGQIGIEFLFTFVSMIVINALFGIFPNIYWIYLPILLLIQCILMMGIVLYLSVISVYIRDIPKLTGVVLQLMFYLTPLIYPITIWPDALEKYFQLNPIAMLVTAYRDVLLYQQPPNMVSLHMPIVVGAWAIVTGYIYLKTNEGQISDYR